MTGAAVAMAGPWPGLGRRGRTSPGQPSGPATKLATVSDIHDVVTRCRAGDAEAFRELFRAHREDVARLAYRMTGKAADLEDLVQEVFLQVHRSISDFRGESRFSTWLYRLTVNVVLMHRRAAKSRPQLVGESIVSQPKDQRLLPDELVVRQRRIAAFRRLVDSLSEKKRTVFVLHELEGLSPAEIGKIVGAPVLTVRTRLFYARREVLAMIREEPALAGLVGDGLTEFGAPTVGEEST
jgi:RNA polymerase sigma-70 factor (ECF subfamily)